MIGLWSMLLPAGRRPQAAGSFNPTHAQEIQ